MLHSRIIRWAAVAASTVLGSCGSAQTEHSDECCLADAVPEMTDGLTDGGEGGAVDETVEVDADGSEAVDAGPDVTSDCGPDDGTDTDPDVGSPDAEADEADVADESSEADAEDDGGDADSCGPVWEPDGWDIPPDVGPPCIPTLCTCSTDLAPEDCVAACGWFVPGDPPLSPPDHCDCPASDAWRPCFHSGECEGCCIPATGGCVGGEDEPRGWCSTDRDGPGCCCVEYPPGSGNYMEVCT